MIETRHLDFLYFASTALTRHGNILRPWALESCNVSGVHDSYIPCWMIHLHNTTGSPTSKCRLFLITRMSRCNELKISLSTWKLWHPTMSSNVIYRWPVLSSNDVDAILGMSFRMSGLWVCCCSTSERVTCCRPVSTLWNVHISRVRQHHRLTN